MDVTFLTLDQVRRIHLSMIETYGGHAGIRDIGMLHSAVSMPQAMFDQVYLHEDLFSMAAAYLYHLVGNHPFVDGNKRTGTASALVFLALNGVQVQDAEDKLVDIAIRTAEGNAEKPEIADVFRFLSIEK